MTGFLLALLVFVVAHLVPAAPPVRSSLVALMGRGPYIVVYSAISLALLAWVVVEARRADVVMLWEPAAWQWVLAFVLMPAAAVLLVCGLWQPNPLSVSIRRGDEPGPVVAITRHPVLWGFLLWSLAHIPANGRLVSVILFGTMGLLSALGMPWLDRKARRRLGDARWSQLAEGTSVVPFAALLSGRGRAAGLSGLIAPVLVALILAAWFAVQGHAWLIGPNPWSGLRAWF
ncbi:NnrU family protein [Alsobacter sp. R-9]